MHIDAHIDRFKKFTRLGTSLLASDAIASICATTRGKRASDALAKLIYHFKDTNPDYANSAIAQIFSISESTLRGILKRRIGQQKVKLGQKSVLAKRIKRQMSIDEVFLMMMPSMGHQWTIDDPSMGIEIFGQKIRSTWPCSKFQQKSRH